MSDGQAMSTTETTASLQAPISTRTSKNIYRHDGQHDMRSSPMLAVSRLDDKLAAWEAIADSNAEYVGLTTSHRLKRRQRR